MLGTSRITRPRRGLGLETLLGSTFRELVDANINVCGDAEDFRWAPIGLG